MKVEKITSGEHSTKNHLVYLAKGHNLVSITLKNGVAIRVDSAGIRLKSTGKTWFYGAHYSVNTGYKITMEGE